MKSILFSFLLASFLIADTSVSLADENNWNKESIKKLLTINNIATDSLNDETYFYLQSELEKCSKTSYKRCSVNTFKLEKMSNSTLSNKIDNALKSLSKEVTTDRKKKELPKDEKPKERKPLW